MDNKAPVPLGITTANAQALILMHLEFVIADKHKLIPSAGMAIKKDGEEKVEAVTSFGPTYMAICSGKHSFSNAATLATDT